MLNSQTIKKNQDQIFPQIENLKKQFLTQDVFKDLIEGKNEWINIQLIIREAFKQIKEAIENQYFYFDQIEQNINQKIDTDLFNKELNKKATVDEVGNLLKDINYQIHQKIDLRNLVENLNDYTLKNEYQKQILQIHEKFESQNEKFIQKNYFKQYQQKLQIFEQQIKQLQEQQQENLQVSNFDKFKQDLDQKMSIQEQQIQEVQNQFTLVQIDMQNKKDKKEIQKELIQMCQDQQQVQKQNEAKINKNQLQIESLQSQMELKAENDDIENMAEKYDEKFKEYESYKIKENLDTQFKSLKILEDQFEQQKLLTKQNIEKKQGQILSDLRKVQDKLQKEIQAVNIKEDYEDFKTQIIIKLNELKNSTKNLQNKTQQIQEQDIQSIQDTLNKFENQIKRNYDQVVSVSNQQIDLREQITEMIANYNTEFQAQRDLQKSENQKKFQKFDKTISQITKNLEGINETKVNNTRFSLLEKKLKQILDTKCSKDQLKKAVNEMNLSSQKIQQIMKESQENLFKNQEKDFKSLLRKKTSNEELNQILKDFTHHSDLEQSQNLLCSAIQSTEQKYKTLNKKLNQIIQLEFDIKEFQKLQKEIPQIKENLLKKIERGDIQYLLNQKANTQQVNAILEQLQTKINKKVSKKDIDKLMEEQNHFNKFFCTELILARFKWKTGLILDDNIIPFDTEVVNTLQENFVWQKNSGILHVVNGGLYEIKYGFFGQKQPIVQILINQNIVYRSTVKNQKSKKHNQNWMFSNNGSTGVSYFLIADNSQVQIQCIGELVVEGFFNIKRF